MPRPVIGVTSYGRDARGRLFVPGDYLSAVSLAGGVPVVLVADGPPAEEILDRIDGILLVGGGDVDPARYGADPHPTVSGIDGGRDAFELALARLAMERRIPLLGICRGAQVMNVALGGDLVQHIPDMYGDAVPHEPANPAGPRAVHPVQVVVGSRLHQILQAEIVQVRSRHHQAVGRLAPGLRVVATAEDGVIEAVEGDDPEHPFAVGVQWHPEDGVAHDPVQQRLFQALVAAAQDSAHRARVG